MFGKAFRVPGLNGRFGWAVIGAAVASVVWTVAVLALSMSPDQARARREPAVLPPPTAVVKLVELREVAWFPCSRSTTTVKVLAPPVPAGSRSVVTRLPAVRAARTGTELVRVGGIPVLAVRTDAVFYRDLRLGERGADIRDFEQALRRAGASVRADGILDAATIRAWRRFDPTSPTDRVRQQTLVAVPASAQVAATMVQVGDPVKPGATLLEVTASGGQFRCEVPNADSAVTRATATLKVGNDTQQPAEVIVRPRASEEPGYVMITPKGQVAGDVGQLGVQSAGSGKPVLAVPLSAVKVDGSGRQVVVVVDGTAQAEVPVALGVTAQGMVAVTGEGIREGVAVRLFTVSGSAGPGGPPGSTEPSPRR